MDTKTFARWDKKMTRMGYTDKQKFAREVLRPSMRQHVRQSEEAQRTAGELIDRWIRI